MFVEKQQFRRIYRRHKKRKSLSLTARKKTYGVVHSVFKTHIKQRKFFGKKAGFISRAWFPHFANWRRDGYDFDSRWDEELAPMRQKRIMDCFSIQEEWFSFALKQRAGFGKGGEKNFEGTVTDLQMGGYLLIRDFRQRINKRGALYGWPLSIYTTPEALWGYDHISSAYSVDPAESKTMIYEQVGKNFPDAAPGELDAVLGWTR